MSISPSTYAQCDARPMCVPCGPWSLLLLCWLLQMCSSRVVARRLPRRTQNTKTAATSQAKNAQSKNVTTPLRKSTQYFIPGRSRTIQRSCLQIPSLIKCDQTENLFIILLPLTRRFCASHLERRNQDLSGVYVLGPLGKLQLLGLHLQIPPSLARLSSFNYASSVYLLKNLFK